jgi:glycosyltransferase involved in cell wall biosynthesis
MIKVASFGFSFYKIARLVNQDPNIRMDVYIHANDYKTFKSEIRSDEDFLHPLDVEAKRIRNLPKGIFWKKQGVLADLFLLSDDAPLFAFPKGRSKTVFLPIGYDLTVLPYPSLALKSSKTFAGKLKLFVIALIQNRRIRSMDRIWASPFHVLANSLEKIRKDVVLNKFVPFPINYQSHDSGNTDVSSLELLGIFETKFLVFFPGRLMTTKSETDLLTGQTKGAEEALRGFLHFQKTCCHDSLLIFVDNSFSPDKEKIVRVISDLGAEHLVVWLKGSASGNRLTSDEMASIYKRCDVILGDFGSGWFGQTALEAAAHGKPFISHMDPEFMFEQFSFNPFVLARTPDEISRRLIELYQSNMGRELSGMQMKKWYENFLSEDAVRRWFQLEIFKAVNEK